MLKNNNLTSRSIIHGVLNVKISCILNCKLNKLTSNLVLYYF
jgi:hypothetical protein